MTASPMMLDIPLHCIYHVQTSVGWNETSRFCLHGAVGASATNGSEDSPEIIQIRFANFIAMARCQFLDQLFAAVALLYVPLFRVDWSHNGEVPPNST